MEKLVMMPFLTILLLITYGYNYNSGGAVIDGNWVVGTSTRGLPNQTLSG